MNIPLDIMVKVAVRTPDVFMSVAGETLRCKTARWLDVRMGGGRALMPPRYIDIKMTNRCNLRCKMCGQWGEQGTFRNASPDVLREELSLEELRELADQVASFRPMFYLWGGEPFLYGDLIPFMRYLKSRRLMCAINTNGTRLLETAEELVAAGSVANILISVDGPREVHDAVRGVEGTYEKVMAGVRRIQDEKRSTGRTKPYLTFVTTVNVDNAREFPEVYEIAAREGIDFVGLQFGTFTTRETGPAYEARMRRCLDCEATSWGGFLSYDTELDIAAVQDGVRRLRGARHPFGTYFVPDLQPEDIPGYYAGTKPLEGHNSCVVPWMRADILPNGDVYPCIDFPDYIVGNIRETSLMELWNGPRYVAFRRELQRGLLPICGRCQTLYEF
ncbi:MAG: radical SAM protein [Candidatus Brocadiia bacterium]